MSGSFSIIEKSYFSCETLTQIGVSSFFSSAAGYMFAILNIHPLQGAVYGATQFIMQKVAFDILLNDKNDDDESTLTRIRQISAFVIPAIVSVGVTSIMMAPPLSWAASISLPIVALVSIAVSEFVISKYGEWRINQDTAFQMSY